MPASWPVARCPRRCLPVACDRVPMADGVAEVPWRVHSRCPGAGPEFLAHAHVLGASKRSPLLLAHLVSLVKALAQGINVQVPKSPDLPRTSAPRWLIEPRSGGPAPDHCSRGGEGCQVAGPQQDAGCMSGVGVPGSAAPSRCHATRVGARRLPDTVPTIGASVPVNDLAGVPAGAHLGRVRCLPLANTEPRSGAARSADGAWPGLHMMPTTRPGTRCRIMEPGRGSCHRSQLGCHVVRTGCPVRADRGA